MDKPQLTRGRSSASPQKVTTLSVSLPQRQVIDPFLWSLIDAKQEVSVFTSRGIKLDGTIVFANESFLLFRASCDQIIFFNEIATICLPNGIFFEWVN